MFSFVRIAGRAQEDEGEPVKVERLVEPSREADGRAEETTRQGLGRRNTFKVRYETGRGLICRGILKVLVAFALNCHQSYRRLKIRTTIVSFADGRMHLADNSRKKS